MLMAFYCLSAIPKKVGHDYKSVRKGLESIFLQSPASMRGSLNAASECHQENHESTKAESTKRKVKYAVFSRFRLSCFRDSLRFQGISPLEAGHCIINLA